MSPGIRLASARCLLQVIVILTVRSAHSQSAPTHAPASHSVTAAPANNPPSGDAAHGKVLYQACTACHSIDDNDIGPKHRGVLGRKAGSVPDYAYSPALKASGIVWDQTNLDRWLKNPSDMVPGTKMYFMLNDPQDRADIIAYLGELK